tara:strand:- start:1545 stop:1661 length:117 start_codon:yes stop_codon:yes gene_type:complete
MRNKLLLYLYDFIEVLIWVSIAALGVVSVVTNSIQPAM